MKKMIFPPASVGLVATVICCAAVGWSVPRVSSAKSTSDARIALSNSFASTSWRQQMLNMWHYSVNQALNPLMRLPAVLSQEANQLMVKQSEEAARPILAIRPSKGLEF